MTTHLPTVTGNDHVGDEHAAIVTREARSATITVAGAGRSPFDYRMGTFKVSDIQPPMATDHTYLPQVLVVD